MKFLQAIGLGSVFMVVALASGCGAGQDGGTGSDDGLASVHLALSGAELNNAAQMVVSFENESGDEVIADSFDLGSGPDVVSRNYRLPPGDYVVEAQALDAAGDVALEGSKATTVNPGDNEITVVLRAPGEDLGDLKVDFKVPEVKIDFVGATGDTLEGGVLDVVVQLTPPDDPANPPALGVSVWLVAPDATFTTSPLTQAQLNPNPSNPLRFEGQLDADFLGAAELQVEVIEDGEVADTTVKQIVGHPTPETEELVAALGNELTLNPDGTLQTITGLTTPSGISLTPDGVDSLNGSIDLINQSVLAGEFNVAADFGNVAPALIFASKSYAWCVLKIIQCELYTAGCIAAAPAAAAACGAVCAGTAGIGCVSCIIAATAGGVAICESAYNCWSQAKKERCL